jgi:hypothetical protein
MKRFTVFSLVSFLIGFMVIACQRDRGVHAGNDDENYKPAPARPIKPPNADSNDEIKGELLRVDTRGKTISVRVENGMVQTFRFNDDTDVAGLEGEPQNNLPKRDKISNSDVGNLLGKEGSEVVIQWKNSDEKIATNVAVTQVSTAPNTRHSGRKH